MRASGVWLLGGESGSIVARTLGLFGFILKNAQACKTHGKARRDGDVMTALSRVHVSV
jgi:hypothetical protein